MSAQGNASTDGGRAAPDAGGQPWQLQVFDVSLKKRQKLAMLLRLLGPLDDERCLLVTNGDNPGSLNHHLRAAGGVWSWCELEAHGIPEMERFLGETVHVGTAESLPYADASFARVVVVDVHEHLDRTESFDRELARILVPGGLALVTTPNGDERLPVARLKHWLGMDPGAYGHTVQGFTAAQLEDKLRAVGLIPERRGAYSRFFTELVELGINFGYVKVLGRKHGAQRPAAGEIAPRNAEQLGSVGGAFRAYRAAFPLIRAFSSLDALVPGRGGYAVAVVARRPS
ncbi:MAG TPA: methyltransferase domain-containing protein [Gemmatimonadaceae bacterium]|nr:methyltransferase domain-containing protein [Gemmatimonadaceae bacterium]